MARPTPDILADLGQRGDDSLCLAIGPQVMALNIAHVRLDGGTQPRAGIDWAVVEDYANDMEANGAEFPPVQVVYDGEAYWLWDGFHRLHARKRNGLYTVPAIVRQGTRRDAVLLSVGANATHGFRRTNEDKRRAVLALLEDEEWGQWADREIARRCAVSHTLVANLRAELSGNRCQIETRRVQRNGTEYTMATPQRTPAPAVASQGGNFATPDELDAAVRSWLVAYDTPEERAAALTEVIELGDNSITFDDLREWIGSVKPRRDADLIQAAARVLIWVRQQAAPFVPTNIEEQVEVEPPVQQHQSDLDDDLWTWAGAEGETALAALLAELMQRNFPYMGVQVRWKSWRAWYEARYPGVTWLGLMDVRDALRKLLPQPEAQQPAAVVEAPGSVMRTRDMEFERKEINKGKTIKIFGRNMDGTLTVTVNSDTVHLYSPGMTLTKEDGYNLTVMMQRAIAQLHQREKP